MTDTYEIWALTDGRAGNIAQAMGLAEAIARTRRTSITAKQITLKLWAAWIPPALSHRLGARTGGWPFSGIARGSDPLDYPWPDLIIGAGRRVGPVVAAMGRLYAMPVVQLLNPQMPPGVFDVVVVPVHDDLTGENVLVSTGALTRLTPDEVRAAAGPWWTRFKELPKPRLAVLIGGPSRSSKFGAADAGNLVDALVSLSTRYGLMITPSRRTPAGLIEALRQRLGETAYLWDGTGDNPYPALLGYADAVLVTGESVNMASEAASTGLPVHIFPVTGVADKIARFHETLAATGASRRFTGEIAKWKYKPLLEADRIAGELIEREIVRVEDDLAC